jgi:L-amino acid N-acyltransferase YncA
VIRPATHDDAAAIASVYGPYVVGTVASFEEVPPTTDEVAARMDLRLPWLVADVEGVVGYAYAGPHHGRAGYRWAVNVSVYLAAEARGRGLGRALYEALLPVLGRLGYVHAFAGIALPNDASVGLHEAVGFLPIGVYRSVGFKFGAWHDVGWWQLQLAEPPAHPAEPSVWDGRLS